MDLVTTRLFPAIFIALGSLVGCSKGDTPPAPPSPPVVSIVVVQPETVKLSSEWIASLDGFVNAQVRPQVSGYLVRRAYAEGSAVKKGQVLFEIDARPFHAALAQSTAQLAEATAQLGRTGRDVERSTALAAEGVVPRSQLENDIQANLGAKAAVQSAEAARSIAALNLGFTRVRSLVDGIAAIATAQIGDLVGPTTLLTTVSQVDPIKAYFSITEQEYLRIASRINSAEGVSSPWQDGGPLTLILADGSEFPQPGTFLAADRGIDPETGTIRISARFPNPEHVLRPGQYGRVRARTRVLQGALLVPARAVNDLQGGAFVRLAADDGKVHIRRVTLGPRSDNRWIVQNGLEPGARVIVDSPQIAEGTRVTTRPAKPAP
jgi:membrane fusion protein (multidrug efflux system)